MMPTASYSAMHKCNKNTIPAQLGLKTKGKQKGILNFSSLSFWESPFPRITRIHWQRKVRVYELLNTLLTWLHGNYWNPVLQTSDFLTSKLLVLIAF